MNHIYKVIYSVVHATYVVAGEFAKSKTKSKISSTSSIKVFSLLALVASINIALMGSAYAASNAYTAGDGAGREGIGDESVAVGYNASATRRGGVAYGYQARATEENGIAIGNSAQSGGQDAIAMGRFAKAIGAKNIAIGSDSEVVNVTGGIAIGYHSIVKANNAIAIGGMAEGENSVALGEGSYTSTNETNVVSVGQSGGNGTYNKRIINLKEGIADNDAINLGQLKRSNEALAGTAIPTSTGSITTGVIYNNFLKRDGSNFGGPAERKKFGEGVGIKITNGTATDDTSLVQAGSVVTKFNEVNTSVNGLQNALNNKADKSKLDELTKKFDGGISFTNGTNSISRKLGETLTIKGENDSVSVNVDNANNAIKIGLGSNLQGLTSVGTTSLTAGNITANQVTVANSLTITNNKITGLADATNDTEAVNLKQLNEKFSTTTASLGNYLNKDGANIGDKAAFGGNAGVALTENHASTDTSLVQAGSVAKAFSEVEKKLQNLGGTVNGGLTFTDGNTQVSKGLGSTVTIKGADDGNTTVNLDQKGVFTVGLGKSLTGLTSVATNTLTATGAVTAGSVQAGNVQIANNKITGLEQGTEASDAVNYGQMDKAYKELKAQIDTITGQSLDQYLMKDGSNIKTESDKKTFGGNVGVALTDNHSASDTSLVQAGSVAKAFSDVGTRLGKLENDATAGFTFSDGTNSVKKELGGTVVIKGADGDNNVTVSQTGGNFVVALGKTLSGLDSVSAKTLTNGTITINQGKITGLADATNSSDAVNLKQLNEKFNSVNNQLGGYLAKDGSNITTETDKKTFGGNVGVKVSAQTGDDDTSLAQVGSVAKEFKSVQDQINAITGQTGPNTGGTPQPLALKLAGDTGGEIQRKLSDTLKFIGGEADANNLTATKDKNIGVVTNAGNGALEIRLAKNLKGLESITATGKVTAGSVQVGNIQIANNKITGLEQGTEASDAVNYGQAKTAYDQLKQQIDAITGTGQGGSNGLLSQFLRKDGSNIENKATFGTNVGVALGDNHSTADTSLVQAGSVAGKFTQVGDKLTELNNALTTKANKSDLDNVTKLANQGLTFSDGRASTKKNLGDTVTIQGADGNLTVTANQQGDFTVALGSSLSNLTSVTARTLTDGTVRISGGKISNLTDATNDDEAVNFGQLKGEIATVNAQLNNYLAKDGANIKADADMKKTLGGNVGVAVSDQTGIDDTSLAQVGSVAQGFKSVQEQINAITGQTGPNTGGTPKPLTLKLMGDSGQEVERKLNETIKFKGGEVDATKLTSLGDKNVGVVADSLNGALDIRLAKNLVGLESITATGKITAGSMEVGGIGINVDQGKITGLANGTNATDAVNYGQVETTYNELKGKIDAITGGPDQNGSGGLLGDFLKKDGSNLASGSADLANARKEFGRNVGVEFTDQIKNTDTSLVQAGGVAGKFTKVGEDIATLKTAVADKADQSALNEIANKVEQGISFSDGKNPAVPKKLGTTVTIQGLKNNNNLTVTNQGGTFTVALGQELSGLRRVQATELTDGTIRITDGKITGLRDGTGNNDAVNLGQLNTKVAGVTTQLGNYLLKDGDNIKDDDGAKRTFGRNVGVAVSASTKANDTSLAQVGSVAQGFKSVQDQINAITGQTGPTPDGQGQQPFAGLTLTGDDQSVSLKRKLSDTIQFTGGELSADRLTATTDKNIGVVVENDALAIRLAKDLKGLETITATGRIAAGSVQVGNVQIANNKITGLADGANASDAVNYGQAKTAYDELNKKIEAITGTGQGGSGGILSGYLEKTGQNIRDDVKTKKEFGKNVGVALTQNHPQDDTTLVQAGSVASEFARVGKNVTDLNSTVANKVSVDEFNRLNAQVQQGLKFSDGTNSFDTPLGGTVTIKGENDSLTVSNRGNALVIALGQSLELDSIRATTLSAGNVRITNGTITGLNDTQDLTGAVNLGRLNQEIAKVNGQLGSYLTKDGSNIKTEAEKKTFGGNVGVAVSAQTGADDTSLAQVGSVAQGFKSVQDQINAITGQTGPTPGPNGQPPQIKPLSLKIEADGTTPLDVPLSKAIKFKGGETDSGRLTRIDDANLGVVVVNNQGLEGLDIRLAKNLKSLETITASGKVTAGSMQVGNIGINVEQGKITGLADGANASDAVNYGQAKTAYDELKKKIDTVIGTDPNGSNGMLGNFLNKSGDNITSKAEFGKNVGVALTAGHDVKDTSLVQAGSVAEGFSQVGTKLDALTTSVNQKADQSLVKPLQDQVKRGLVFSDGRNEFSGRLGDKVTIKGEDANVVVKADTQSNSLTIALGKALTGLTSVQANEFSAGSVTIRDGKITGLKNNDQDLTGAINLGQLNQEIAKVNGQLGTYLNKSGDNLTGKAEFGKNVGVKVSTSTGADDTSLAQVGSVAQGFKSVQDQINAITGQTGPNPDGTPPKALTLKLAGDNGQPFERELSQVIKFKGGESTASKLTATTDKNLGVIVKDNALEVRLAKNLNGLESITASGKITAGSVQVGNIGINVEQGKITGLQNGTNANDAVNYGQAKAAYDELNKKIDAITGTGQNNTDGLLKDYLMKDGSNLSAAGATDAQKKQDKQVFGKAVGVALSENHDAKDTSLVQAGSVAQGFSQVTTKLDGLTTQVANKVDRTQFDTLQTTVNKGLTFSDGNSASDYKAGLGGKVTIKGVDNDANLTVANQNGTFTVALGKTLTGLTSVQAGTITANTLTAGAVSISGGKIKGLTDAKAKDEAVNYGQLETAYTDLNNKIDAITGQNQDQGLLKAYLMKDGSNLSSSTDQAAIAKAKKDFGSNVGIQVTATTAVDDTSLAQAGSVAKLFKEMQKDIENISQSSISGFNGDADAPTTVVYANQASARANTVSFVGGETDPNKLTALTDKNFGVVKSGANKFEFRLAKNLSGLESITMGPMGLSATTGINMGGLTISNLGKATADNQAVNFGQVKDIVKQTHDAIIGNGGGTGGGTGGVLDGYAKVDGSNITDKAKFGANVGTNQINANSTELAQAGAVHNAIKEATSVKADVKNEADTSKNLLDRNADLSTNLVNLADQINKNSLAVKNGASGGANAAVKEVSTRVNRLETKVNKLASHVKDVDERLQAGIAGSTAIAMLQSPIRAGGSSVSAAVGGYKDKAAVAVGYAVNSDDARIQFKVGASMNPEKDVNYGASIGYNW